MGGGGGVGEGREGRGVIAGADECHGLYFMFVDVV